ncbi:MAG: nuclear transport factor 2 family protein [Burkholderiales bacterium]
MASMRHEEMDRVIREHFAGEAAQDTERVLGTLTADAEHDVVGLPSGQGAEYIRHFYDGLYKILQQENVTPLRRYYGEDFAVDEVLYTAQTDGAMFGAAGRRGRISVRMLHVLEFRDGRISRENVWIDWAAGKAQLLATPN